MPLRSHPGTAQSFSKNKIEARFADAMQSLDSFTPEAVLAVAVSGGADSMALLLLTHQWIKTCGGKVIALTVDHNLRKDSADETKQVSVWCDTSGIQHHTLLWKSAVANQAAARDARYALLTEACRAHGAKYLLTAHHAGDQAETLFFRLARGSGLRGLACIPSSSHLENIHLLRPLLHFTKKELMQYLQEHNQPWIEDPTNSDPHYTRNAIRAELSILPNSQEIEARAANVAAAFNRIREALDAKTEEAFHTTMKLESGHATIDAKAYAQMPFDLALLTTARLIREMTGQAYPPRTEKLERLTSWLQSPNSPRVSLAHVAFEFNAKANAITATYAA